MEIIRKHLLLNFIAMFLFQMYLFAEAADAGQISGKLITKDSEPMANAIVFFFNVQTGPPPSPDKYWRIPDKTVTTNDQGRFVADLTKGNYYIGVVYKSSWAYSGPPRGEDLKFIRQETEGMLKTYSVREDKENNIGVISEADLFKIVVGDSLAITTIEGYVIDAKGEPVERATALAYYALTIGIQPAFASDFTGNDGHFILRVPGSGTYYLRARYGQQGKTAIDENAVTVTIETGETVTGIDLKVKR